MPVQLNHTIVHAPDPAASAQFFADILALPPPKPFGHFLVVQTDNGVSLDFMRNTGSFSAQHYAFLVSEADFDAAFARIQERKLQFWADPMARQPGEINHHDGGRGVYFQDPAGHYLELITRPYGGGDLER
jgi:catechol 2,3-dioxygenase-like lactoylglutathione lyase family enzyme